MFVINWEARFLLSPKDYFCLTHAELFDKVNDALGSDSITCVSISLKQTIIAVR